MLAYICECEHPEPEIITEEQYHKRKPLKRTRLIEICANCSRITDKPPLTKWVRIEIDEIPEFVLARNRGGNILDKEVLAFIENIPEDMSYGEAIKLIEERFPSD
ncbi:hypothetical protein [Heyndrickxia camelliae]|uniref:Uncharacterized protein n=1 Tax=Heyndrickxia camelliae TaxID=1707093 RepID=A0A2N3LNJ1_9BACI|nr:hypothetical protein [Heyndrickxia camelliae]PKR86109.1 hypothetical protein CWO92_06980 [Heyndrickxia camelliae]